MVPRVMNSQLFVNEGYVFWASDIVLFYFLSRGYWGVEGGGLVRLVRLVRKWEGGVRKAIDIGRW